MHTHTNNHHRLIRILLTLFLTALPQAHAEAVGEVHFTMRPHCYATSTDGTDPYVREIDPLGVKHLENLQDTMIGISNDGTPGVQASCPGFLEEDAQTYRTKPLSVGDILDMDIVLENPSRESITRVRSWLTYDPEYLHGDVITMRNPFPVPEEKEFLENEGHARIGGYTEGEGVQGLRIVIARVQFSVKKIAPNGTIISFYDATPQGHTSATTGPTQSQRDLGARALRALRVTFTGQSPTTPPASSSSSASVLKANGETCTEDRQCTSNICNAGRCSTSRTPACIKRAHCASGNCKENICEENAVPSTASSAATVASASVASSGVEKREGNSAFSLLQVQNLRATTEGSAVYLRWDPLRSSQLKAYNVYYGTTSGRYIQRKTVDGSTTNLALRSLPIGTTYYFAVRAVDHSDQESAFSQEVAVTVGDPKSSTAPFSVEFPTNEGQGKNPLEGNITENRGDIPGETGIPSMVVILVLMSAVIATMMTSSNDRVAEISPQRSSEL